MACAICQKRRPRRFCPGVSGDICTICCGTEREITVSCPLDCPYLRDARAHERVSLVDPDKFPNQDIRVTDDFLREHEPLLIFSGRSLAEAAAGTNGAIDYDVRDALNSLIRTYRTLQSGVYYETRPDNAIASALFTHVQEALAEYRREETENLGMTRTRDADILGVFVFLQRLEFDRNNGRARGRAFLDFLRGFFPGEKAPVPSTSSLVLP
jgi:hypothetical protein